MVAIHHDRISHELERRVRLNWRLATALAANLGFWLLVVEAVRRAL